MSSDPENAVDPFLKWAGGKRWFIRRHEHLFPKVFNRYIEPFLGGAAVFFSLRPAKPILSDTNASLIGTYQAIRDNWALVWRYLLSHQALHSKEYYYVCRAKKYRSTSAKAAQFIYLNRACWNGLYRVNLRGDFNVPIGTKDTIVFDNDNFETLSDALRSAKLLCCDFERTIDLAKRGDFVFVDPPYTINHNANGFLKYNEKIFSWHDQKRLRSALERARDRGAKILVTNADHRSVRELYAGFGNMVTVPRFSVLSGDASFRKLSTELIVSAGC
ncbi:MAG TPA: Dam family site-specific DNA-(adenine-N6)-methyltransferase [Stellaceae bacterium]|nr:Dam family site-specific DNA-(adenine-N6)-methyltransferase [Stellaceae bacterium]